MEAGAVAGLIRFVLRSRQRPRRQRGHEIDPPTEMDETWRPMQRQAGLSDVVNVSGQEWADIPASG
jgi:hypothetical protein